MSLVSASRVVCDVFFFNDTATTEIYTLSLHDALPISSNLYWGASIAALEIVARRRGYTLVAGNKAGNNVFFVRDDVDRKSTRLNSSHANISYAVFCLKKKKQIDMQLRGIDTISKLHCQ